MPVTLVRSRWDTSGKEGQLDFYSVTSGASVFTIGPSGVTSGSPDYSAAAVDITVIADTIAALEFFDSTTKFMVFDTRVTVTGVANITMTGMPATIVAAAGITHKLLSLASGTTTLTGNSAVTALNGLGLTVAQPTVTSAGTPATATASTVYIAAEPAAAGTATITAPYALHIASGNMLTAGKIIVDDVTDSTTGTTGSIQTDGGIGAALEITSDAGFKLVAGDLDMGTAAGDIVVPANAVAALEFYDATTKFLVLDTRNTVTGTANITATGIPATIVAAAGVTHNLVSLAPGITTLTGATGVNAMNGLGLTVGQPTITSAAAPATAVASTVYIAAAPLAAGTATITAGYALSIGAGNMLTAGRIIIDDVTDSTSTVTGSLQTDGGLGVALDFFLGGDISIATAKKITTAAELTLNSVDPFTIQIGGVDLLQADEAAIAAFAAAADTAGHDAYLETEDGGADGGAGTGRAGGLFNIKTGDGSASATAAAVGGAGGALSLITGAGLTGNTTGNGGVGGALAITAGAGGDSGAGAGVGGTGGTITLTAGAGGGAGGGTAGAPGQVTIGAGVFAQGVQTINMGDVAVTLTLVPGTPAGTLLTANVLYVDAQSGTTEDLLFPPEADCAGMTFVVVNTGGETIEIQNNSAGAVLTLETANTAIVTCDGTTLRGFVGIP